ncbi:MAG: hypothetical protein ACI87E_005327 [Mariniblastus sp.]|jgi:hypothetical protein
MMRFGLVLLFLASLLISSGCKTKDATPEKKSEAANVVTDMNIQKAPDGK